jgi:hypothetical protein
VSTATSSSASTRRLGGLVALPIRKRSVREQLRILLDGERLNVVQLEDGSVWVRGALDLGAILEPQKPREKRCRYVDCGGPQNTMQHLIIDIRILDAAA